MRWGLTLQEKHVGPEAEPFRTDFGPQLEGFEFRRIFKGVAKTQHKKGSSQDATNRGLWEGLFEDTLA